MKVTVKGINLLPKEYIQAQQAKRIRIIVGALVLLEACLFIGVIAIPPKNKISNLEKEVEYVIQETKADKFKDVNKTIEELEIAKKGVQEWVDKYGNIKKENIISVRMLDSLTSRVPVGVTLLRIEILPSEEEFTKATIDITLSGYTEAIHSYMNVVESIYGRGNVELTSKVDEKTGVVESELIVTIPLDTVRKDSEVVETDENTESNQSSEGEDN